ncbi:MAG: SIS domain-containing protein [Saprospiraceae bacterium]|nr:SIS domain-containing protein [Saprospiraceae bacterium]
MHPRIEEMISQSIAAKQAVLADKALLAMVDDIANHCIKIFQEDGKVLFCGNGGSAADAQHLATELSGRFYFDRPPLFSEALNANTAFITAVGNDYGFDHIFARMARAAGRAGDVLFALSTSGNSPNVLNAIEAAREIGMKTIGMTGASGGKMIDRCDWLIRIPSSDTPRIQECHMMIGHLICELVEEGVFGDQKEP